MPKYYCVFNVGTNSNDTKQKEEVNASTQQQAVNMIEAKYSQKIFWSNGKPTTSKPNIW